MSSRSNYLKPLSFSTEEAEIRREHVNIGTQTYIIQEASGASVDKYKRKVNGSSVVRDGVIIDYEKESEAGLDLLTDCIFKQISNPPNNLPGEIVSRNVVGSWPERISKQLVHRLKFISDMMDFDKTSIEEIDKEIEDLTRLREELLKRMEAELGNGTSTETTGSN